MKFEKGHWAILIFNAIYILAFSIYYLSIKNYEFIWYVVVLISFFTLILATINKSKLDYFALWGLSIWGLLHMCGGGLIVNGDVLYNLKIIHLFDIGDTFVLKFDQFVHLFGFSVTAIVALQLLKPQLRNKPNYKLIYPLAVLISMGAGAFNEIVEFIATISFASVNVGGYYNTALDLVFNMIGAIIGVSIEHFRKK